MIAFSGYLKKIFVLYVYLCYSNVIKGLQALHPDTFEQLHPFTLLALIREGKVTRKQVCAVFTFLMFADQIDVSTFIVTVSVMPFARRQECQEELVALRTQFQTG